MKSFETAPVEEPIRPDQAPETPEDAQESAFDPEKAVSKERGMLEKLGEKAKRIGRVFLAVSAFAVGTAETKEAHADTAAPKNVPAQKAEKEVEKINKANLTESSAWSKGAVDAARADMKNVKTPQDAEMLVRVHFQKFVSEYYMPTKGNVKDVGHGMKAREYTEDDARFMLQQGEEMKKVVEEMNVKFGIQAYEKRMAQIDDMLLKMKRQTSYAYQKQLEALEELRKKQ